MQRRRAREEANPARPRGWRQGEDEAVLREAPRGGGGDAGDSSGEVGGEGAHGIGEVGGRRQEGERLGACLI